MNRSKDSFKQRLALSVGQFVTRCPKTGRIVGIRRDSKMSRLFFPAIGLAAVVWFLVRVVPKPSRAIYPCQRVAAGIGGSFLAYAVGLMASFSLCRCIRRHLRRPVTAALVTSCVAFGLIATAITAALCADSNVVVLRPPEGINKPMGQARGIHAGRVVWVQDFDATSWDGENGHWWDDKNTDQEVVEAMFSQAIQKLTATRSDADAWDALFRYHNKANGKGERGYQKNETITVKLNCNTDRRPGNPWGKKGYPSPHMVYTLVTQLIEQAGVPGAHITLTDPSRHIGDPIYHKIRSNPKPDYQQIVFAETADRDQPQRLYAEPDMTCPIHFDMPDGKKRTFYFPKVFTNATYLINAGQFRPHRVFGITMAGKNHFGSVYDGETYTPSPLHAFALWDYSHPNKHGDPHCHPALLGHKVTNGKTFLYMLDGLYTSHTQSGDVIRWSTMGHDWFSSVLMSQDPIALDSVGYDFVRSEPDLVKGNNSFNGHVDSFLHESALAHQPPSGATYDPEQDGTTLTSVGVHEHWNNAVDKKYSRNLGTGNGIELICVTGKATK